MRLKGWLVKVLRTIIATYIMFVATTIETLGNSTYDKILIVYTIVTLISFRLLSKYSNVFDD